MPHRAINQTANHLTSLVLGVTVLMSLAITDRTHRPPAGLRKAIELIARDIPSRIKPAAYSNVPGLLAPKPLGPAFLSSRHGTD